MAQQSQAQTTLAQTADTQTDASAAEDAPVAEAPSSDFRYASGTPVAGDPVLFEAETDADGCRYEWDFGDDSTATSAKASNIYDEAGRKEVTLNVTDDDGRTETTERTLTVYRGVEMEVRDADEDLVAVTIRGDGDFDPADDVAVESLRFGAPTAVAMGTGAAPVRTETDDGDLRVEFRTDRGGLGEGTTRRLAGRTTDGVPLAGTTDDV